MPANTRRQFSLLHRGGQLNKSLVDPLRLGEMFQGILTFEILTSLLFQLHPSILIFPTPRFVMLNFNLRTIANSYIRHLNSQEFPITLSVHTEYWQGSVIFAPNKEHAYVFCYSLALLTCWDMAGTERLSRLILTCNIPKTQESKELCASNF